MKEGKFIEEENLKFFFFKIFLYNAWFSSPQNDLLVVMLLLTQKDSNFVTFEAKNSYH